MRKFTAPVLAALLLAFAPPSLQAEPKPTGSPHYEGQAGQQPPTRGAQQQPQSQPPKKSQPVSSDPSGKSQYGEWKSAWGKTPPAPPKHWSKKNDWHRHVRICQQRYKSYSARTDTYRTRSGKQLRCQL